jgi:hypothetical protein
VVAVTAVMPTTLGLSFLAIALGSPLVTWTTEDVVVGRRVDEVEEVAEEVVAGFWGGAVVVLIDHVSPGPDNTVDVVLARVENGREEQPLRAAARARPTRARARARFRGCEGTRFML